MINLYNFYAKLDKYNWRFVHYEWAWKSYKPKEKYTIGNQINLLLETPVTAFLSFFVWLHKVSLQISNRFALKGVH